MSARFLACIASVSLVLVGAVLASAATPTPSPELTSRVYQVADLVVPVPDVLLSPGASGMAPSSAPRTCEARLMKVIADTVQPRSWATVGGAGTMDYFPLGMGLVVNQTPEAHAQIDKLLASLRRLQDVQVALETRIVSVSEETYQALAVMYGAPFFISRVTHLNNEGELETFLSVAQNDKSCNIMQGPKCTLFNGQKAALAATDRQASVTSLDTQRLGEQTVLVPRPEVFETGVKYAVRPTVSPDRRTVNLNVALKVISLDSEAVLHVGVPVPALPRKNGEAQPAVVLTQVVQQPHFTTLAIEKAVKVADGKTVLFDLGTRSREVRQEFGPPVLRRVPYVNRLFKNVGYGRETEHVLCLITPRIIVNEEEEEKKPEAVEPAGEETDSRPGVLPEREKPKPAPVPNVAGDSMPIAAEQQVQLDVVLAHVARGQTRDCGFDLLSKAFPPAQGSSGDLRGGVIGSATDFLAYLRVLEKKNLAKVLTQPVLVTLSGKQASFLAGGEVTVPVPAGLGEVGVQFEEFGTRLNFLPTVLSNGKVRLEVVPEVKVPSNAGSVSLVANGQPVEGRETQRARVTVEMESGQAFVLGGLIQRQVEASTSTVPLLGQLPIVGACFSTQQFVASETELVLVVTSRVIGGRGQGLVAPPVAKDANSPVRHVKSRAVKLRYTMEDVNLQALCNVEVWQTRDTRTWERVAVDAPANGPCTVKVRQDGRYGFTLVPCGQDGPLRPAPVSGDQPQIWVEVDATKPVVKLTGVEISRDNAEAKLTIRWAASDKNLKDRPIRIFYAKAAGSPPVPVPVPVMPGVPLPPGHFAFAGEWEVLPGASNLTNSGEHTTTLQCLPSDFVLGVVAVDQAGNAGSAETSSPIHFDPKVLGTNRVEVVDEE